jgi:hypothetical protein
MLRIRNYNTKRTDLREPGQPIVGGHSHVRRANKSSPSKIAEVRSRKKKRSWYSFRTFFPGDEDDATDLPPAPSNLNDQTAKKPMGVKDYMMWKIVKIGRPRQP